MSSCTISVLGFLKENLAREQLRLGDLGESAAAHVRQAFGLLVKLVHLVPNEHV